MAKNSLKTILITGANKGIGYEISRQLAELGCNIILTARDEKRGSEAADSLIQQGYNVNFILMDVSDQKSIHNAANEFEKNNNVLDVLINNAAILLDRSSDITKMDFDTINETLRNNTIGTILVTQAFLQFIPEFGRIINISSEAGSLNKMNSYSPAYSISKAALNAVTKQFASILSYKHIAVNSLCPGWVRSDMGGKAASRSVQKGAETAVWLATEAPQNLSGKFFKDKKEIPW